MISRTLEIRQSEDDKSETSCAASKPMACVGTTSLNPWAQEMLSVEETADLQAARPGEMKTDQLLFALVDPSLDERGPGIEKYAARHTVCMEGRSTLSSLPLLDELRTYCYEHRIEEIPALLVG
jgi:hypothetical protein